MQGWRVLSATRFWIVMRHGRSRKTLMGFIHLRLVVVTATTHRIARAMDSRSHAQ